MKLLRDILIDGILFHFYKGFDTEAVSDHAKDGSDGFMVLLVNADGGFKIANMKDIPCVTLFSGYHEM